ncbi:LytR family transcriptional regulator [Bacillus sp. AFS055030]|uniref:polyisoprenyl-teichoic acid--peptidoglycan teichoic acid transferase TagU n=1 Tax=Bacillus sp. AFS055030 TaxID=2033507 RepID=UPI000BFB741D|nr:LytR family transcriptional regulator [Bacillus sp. AFS055030]PGL72730.1 LytR family transcriptional regulator [Bacillus sp. AFS055030]
MSTTKKVLLTLVSVLVVIGLGIGGYAYSIYHNVNKTTDAIYKGIKKTDKRKEEVSVEKKEPFSILLLGVDHRPGDKGRSDTMIVLTVNPNTNTTKMVSIPRDTRTEIVGKGKQDKINHAYAFGGIQMAVDSVENFLNIPIDYYLEVNMEGFKDIVEAVGGVDVNNDLDFTYGGVHFTKGPMHLNGDDALLYSRMRKQDPRGDFGRQLRQRQVIEAVIKKGATISSLTNYQSILQAIQKNVVTNFGLNDMVSIQKDYRVAAKNITETQITGQGKLIDKIYYLLVSDEDRNTISNDLRQHLELPLETK